HIHESFEDQIPVRLAIRRLRHPPERLAKERAGGLARPLRPWEMEPIVGRPDKHRIARHRRLRISAHRIQPAYHFLFLRNQSMSKRILKPTAQRNLVRQTVKLAALPKN